MGFAAIAHACGGADFGLIAEPLPRPPSSFPLSAVSRMGQPASRHGVSGQGALGGTPSSPQKNACMCLSIQHGGYNFRESQSHLGSPWEALAPKEPTLSVPPGTWKRGMGCPPHPPPDFFGLMQVHRDVWAPFFLVSVTVVSSAAAWPRPGPPVTAAPALPQAFGAVFIS